MVVESGDSDGAGVGGGGDGGAGASLRFCSVCRLTAKHFFQVCVGCC